ncbi:MAG: heme-binding protein [Sphingomonadaceae bacterium]
MPRTIETVTLADSRSLLAAGRAKAEELGIAYNLAVVDAGGNLVAFERMDGAWVGSIDIALHKAFTARAFDMATDKLGAMATPDKSLFGIQNTNHGHVVIFGGGVPLKHDGKVIGAVGVSGGQVEQDLKVVEAAVSAFEKELEAA